MDALNRCINNIDEQADKVVQRDLSQLYVKEFPNIFDRKPIEQF
jgi:hypothetical protein